MTYFNTENRINLQLSNMKFGDLLYTLRNLTLPKKTSQANLARLKLAPKSPD